MTRYLPVSRLVLNQPHSVILVSYHRREPRLLPLSSERKTDGKTERHMVATHTVAIHVLCNHGVAGDSETVSTAPSC